MSGRGINVTIISVAYATDMYSTCRVGRLGKAKLGPVGRKIYRTLNENATSLQHGMSADIYFLSMIDYIYNQQGN